MAAMKPRTGDGPIEVAKESRVIEMNAAEASELLEALKAVVG